MASRIKEGIRDMFTSRDDLDYPSEYARQRILANQIARGGPVPVLELRVPMCCEKCQEKVKEAVEECDGVRNVVCDQYNQRVTVTGFADPLKVLRRVRKVKKKSEFFRDGTFVNRTSHPVEQSRSLHLPAVSAPQTRYTASPLVRTHSSGFGRLPHEGAMVPMAIPHARVPPRHNALVPVDLRRDFTGIRRMPSFKRYRHHDAEYLMGDEYAPPTRYVSYRSQRPLGLLPQVSFSKLPVTNPHYLKHIESEYY